MNSARSVTALLLLTASFSLAQTPAADSLTVSDAIQLVLAHNPSLTEAAQIVEASQARVEQSRSPYFPSAEIGASYAFISPVPQISLGDLTLKVAPNNNYDGHLGARQMIYDFQRTGSQVSLSNSRVTIAEDSRETVKRDLSFRTADVFFAILFLRRSIVVQDEQIRTLNEHLDIARKKIEAGTAMQLDALTTQVRVANATMLRINLETALRTQETNFRKLAGLPPASPLRLQGEFAAQPMPFPGDSLLSIALTSRIEAKTAQDAIATAEAQRQVARSSDAPSVSAIASYGVKNGYIPNLDILRGNVLAGVALTIPVLDGHRSRSMEEEAEALLLAAEARKRETDQMIQADVEQAVTEARAAAERVKVTEINIQQADLAVRTARLRYEAGSVANLDLLDALTDQTQARLTNLQSLYDAVVSNFRLRRAVGAPVF
jgi:outer membrane protein TolC